MIAKLYSAEKQMLGINVVAGHSDSDPTNAQILAVMRALQAEVSLLTSAVRNGTFVPQEIPEAAPLQQKVESEEYPDLREAEVILLKTQLRSLARSIQDTKHEISALKPASSHADRLVVVNDELDAVVAATEVATDSILSAVEHIDALASQILARDQNNHFTQIADEIKEWVVSIFEACNFQDITGQRITKVVNTLKYVEERVEAMVEIWGRDSFVDMPRRSAESHRDAEAALLNGPSLKPATQDDIDSLFG